MALLVLSSSSFNVAAQESVVQDKAFDFAAAKSLQAENLSARLSIKSMAEPGIRLSLNGSKRQIELIVIEKKGTHLIIRGETPAKHATSSSIVIVNGNSRASVTINDNTSIITSEPEPLLEMTLQLGAAIPVDIIGFSGSVVAGPMQAPLILELNSGDARLAAVHDANLSITGSGRITLDHANSNLMLAVRGSGDIVVGHADLDALDVTILGAGNVRVSGQAKRATLMLKGAGNIAVETVMAKPQRQLLGVGAIRVGNW